MVCWTPGLVVLLLDGLDCDAHYVLAFEKYCLVLAECNSLVNPIIYSFRDKDMRSTFKRILCCLCRRCPKPQAKSLNLQTNSVKQEVLPKGPSG